MGPPTHIGALNGSFPSAHVTASHPPNASVITPLRFVAADPSGSRRRALVGHRQRGRQLITGWEMHGNLHTLGYFSADLCVGTPPRSFDLIVDTGSSLTAVPCADCTQCGAHKHDGQPGARFSEAASSTSQPCTTGRCSYSVSYTEGSKIRGKMIEDSVWFGSAKGRKEVHASFGCQTFESGLFYSQVADGITGFSMRSSYGPTLFEWLQRATGCPRVFSICLSEEVGAMVLGGAIPSDLQADWIPTIGTDAYQITLTEIKIGQRSLGVGGGNYGRTIVDSGTTFMYLPPKIYR